MRPNGEEELLGIQSALATYIMPEVQTDHARLELMLVVALLGAVAGEWDGAAQRLVDDNAGLRELARRGAEALGAEQEDPALADELRSLADESDPSVRLSDLTTANAGLRDALVRASALVQDSDVPALSGLRAAVIDHLRADAEARTLSLLGPRADG